MSEIDANRAPALSPRALQRVLMVILAILAIVGASTWIGVALASNALVGGMIGSGVGSALGLLIAGIAMRRGGPPVMVCAGPPSRTATQFGGAIALWMSVYVLAVVLISWVFDIDAWPVWARAIAAVTPALPIGGVIYALLKYLKTEHDEYQRMLMTRAVLWAMGFAFFVLTAWGFLELYLDVPHFPVAFAMTPFWLAFGAANWWVRRS
jgi:hypothetical protein